MSDSIERLGKSIIQHGKYNDRIYLMKLVRDDFPVIVKELDGLAKSRHYSKIFAKVPAFAKDILVENGYDIEAYVPGFFNGDEDAYLMSKYLSLRRRYIYAKNVLDEVLIRARSKLADQTITSLPAGYRCDLLSTSEVFKMAKLYRRVFTTYPFPIYDPDYLLKTMARDVTYFGIYQGDQIVALASSEVDIDSKNVEMTDFATLPEHRGHGFAVYLLREMEGAMRKRGAITAYTIARATSYGINATFAKMGYQYGGTLVNNTNISGNLESMNVWYKTLMA